VSPLGRILGFGSAAVLVIAGAVCAVAFEGLTSDVLAMVLITVGLGEALLLVFMEIGLSEDRERAREEKRRRPRPPRRLRPIRRGRRPG
jgi:hypothetical protein